VKQPSKNMVRSVGNSKYVLTGVGWPRYNNNAEAPKPNQVLKHIGHVTIECTNELYFVSKLSLNELKIEPNTTMFVIP
jgi:hypothetical protein